VAPGVLEGAPMRHRLLRPLAVSLLAVPAVLTSPLAARAQTVASGFALSPYTPAERGSDWMAADALDLRGDARLAVGATLDHSARPLTFHRNGADVGAPVRSMTQLHVGGALVFAELVRFGVDVPLLLAEKGEATAYRAGEILPAGKASTLGDVRLGADVKLLGSYRSVVTSALGVGVFLPTGKQEAYTSDGHVRVVPRLSFAGAAGPIDWALSGGVQVTKQTGDYANRPSGTAVTFSAAVGVRTMDDKLLVGPEVYGSTGTKELLQRESSPVEGILSARCWMTPGLRIGAGAGTGLTTGFGASRLRALATLEWVAPIEAGPGDRDKDGILDPDDACPDTAGVKSSDPKTNGCPVSDRDADGILDADDACPDEAGKASSDPRTNGCPVRDRDKDGVLDPEDACPDQAGPKDADPKKNGCPAVRVENGQIKIIDQVKFRTASSVILPESDGILNNVAAVLKERTEITKVRVEGHTDNRGAAGADKTLSQQRAAAVVAWLVKHGIDAKRLTSQGFGQDRPVDSNDTEAGRQNNRRVEFHIE